MPSKRRKIIYTREKEITRKNVVDVLRSAMAVHEENAARIKFLFDFEGGEQPISRPRITNKQIDIQCVDNVAHEITKFHVGYEWGNPITLVQRGCEKSNNEIITLAISELNEMYEAEGIKTKSQKLGKDVTVCNLGYTFIETNTEWEEGESYFKINVLSPYTTFIVRSSYYLDRRPMMGVTYMVDDLNVRHYTVYTKDTRFDIAEDEIKYEILNPLGRIPIIEWVGNYDGMGLWEHEISEMNNLNTMISDYSIDVEINMNCIWHTNDVDFPTEITTDSEGNEVETVKKPSNGEWMQTYTTPDGKTPKVEPLTLNYDYGNMLENINARRSLILEKCFVPQRTDGTNSTGVAQDIASGYSSLDIVAESIQAIQESCKQEEIKVMLAAVKASPDLPADSPIFAIRAMDLQPSVKRERLSEISTKINAFATGVSHGIHGLDMLQLINAFPDTNQTWERSKALIEKYQTSVFDQNGNEAVGGKEESAPNADRIMQDKSDQLEQTPLLEA